MLCRVADSLFWMSRYIERADNTIRLVEVTFQTLLESDITSEEAGYRQWRPILESLGDEALFESLYDEKTSYNVTHFLSFNPKNPSSVFSCVAAARENARMIRDQISTEMWEIMNRMYLFLKNSDAERLCREISFDFVQRVKEYAMLFQGTTETTFPHSTGYEFLICGFQLERADKTCRIVESQLCRGEDGDGTVPESAEWAGILKACSALEAYQHEFVAIARREPVLSFLLLSRHFPRSASYCINRLQLAIHAISGCPVTHFSNEAERRVGLLISSLNYSAPADLAGGRIASFIQGIEDSLEDIARELSAKYMFAEIADPAAALSGE